MANRTSVKIDTSLDGCLKGWLHAVNVNQMLEVVGSTVYLPEICTLTNTNPTTMSTIFMQNSIPLGCICPFVKTNPTTRYTQPAGLRILSKCIWPFDNPTPDPECGIHNSGMSIVLAIVWQMFWLLVQHQCRVYTIFRHINVHLPKPTQQLLYLKSGTTICFECFRSAYVYAKAKYTVLPHLRIPAEQ